MVHSEAELEKAIATSSILFGKATTADLKKLDEQTFLDVFDGVTQTAVPTDTGFLKSKKNYFVLKVE